MFDALSDILAHKYNYLGFIILMMIGLWAMLAKSNLAKKILGMAIFQSAIILFYISVSVKENATLPILEHHGHGDEHGAETAAHGVQSAAHATESTLQSTHDAAQATSHGLAESAHDAMQAANDVTHSAVNATGDALHAAAQAVGEAAAHGAHAAINAADYVNPLPHVLMLTAIVVSVATLGVALALAMKIYKEYNTLDEDVILEKIRQ
ncbi:hypothetical protein DPQ33_06870 [Oceanidesulfovibrio indonesiensis]|uniref:NADH-quinone oxidoreductase subunit J n=1 Tax=Oceanidesulfovibrio indonesiensis TaxID=54767 RepID=A0A7M3MGU0_9BACT|nr:cation:proton antiporter subunit C [Oceanidesulfovibrio indonesiensis]TVM18459.1 hypothetical protein DPQ33_06870 [Oceanidesulfovibrio indonesiensis]